MAYLDGELPVERAASAATHLQECRECQILAAELKSISESLTAWEVEQKEPEMSADLAKALEEPEASLMRRKVKSGVGWTRGDRGSLCRGPAAHWQERWQSLSWAL